MRPIFISAAPSLMAAACPATAQTPSTSPGAAHSTSSGQAFPTKPIRVITTVTGAKFAEVGADTFVDAALTVVDSPHAFKEAGDLIVAAKVGALRESRQATLGQILTGSASLPRQGLVIFKSVGMALQDLALAARY